MSSEGQKILKHDVKTYDSEFWMYFVGFIVIVTGICFIPYLVTQKSWVSYDFGTSNEIGDTIGGVLAPFVAILASGLTFLAFWVQYKANQQQRYDLRIERFENKFYELLRLQNSNVEKMNIADRVTGHKCFIQMFYEFKSCYLIVEDQHKVGARLGVEYGNINLLKFAYSIFFIGIGNYSEKQLLVDFSEKEILLFNDCKKVMMKLQEDYKREKDGDKFNKRYYTFDLPLTGVTDDRTKIFYYLPFNGHSNRLGHYYRHLFQTVSYIVGQSDDEFSFGAKYEYIKMLRAQLSNYQQLMLYFNGIAWFEKEWRPFFTDYRLIKNLPLRLADFGITPEEKFKEDIDRLKIMNIAMFDIHEKRMTQ